MGENFKIEDGVYFWNSPYLF